jgi:hypothetical protein
MADLQTSTYYDWKVVPVLLLVFALLLTIG